MAGAVSVIATALPAGASRGLSIAAPIGPTSLLCIRRTLAGALPTGLATGLGVATVHLTDGTLAARWGAGRTASTRAGRGLLSAFGLTEAGRTQPPAARVGTVVAAARAPERSWCV
ncbi:hypothetical protein ASG51_02970 [Methylobacterium sp. Leaf465]|uniref:hypothetical protein n=1 Tax=unclassified Methylobacterium TaxID=2615210 RepID=UPI0006F61025|nr:MULTISPECIES: hypothetical protein [unclassified Methylobacterium]KQT79632.1 hypothetical protein ASG51_02970 [Methylobacterium sp. Leaf465]KQU16508.1 hypothetical protein ASG63_10270 [Methylobacterium sp. Leaf94]